MLGDFWGEVDCIFCKRGGVIGLCFKIGDLDIGEGMVWGEERIKIGGFFFLGEGICFEGELLFIFWLCSIVDLFEVLEGKWLVMVCWI